MWKVEMYLITDLFGDGHNNPDADKFISYRITNI